MQRTLARGLTALAVSGLATLGAAAPATAAPVSCTVYPPGAVPTATNVTCTGDGVVVSVQVVTAGKATRVLVTVAGFGKKKVVHLTLHSKVIDLGDVTTDANGSAAGYVTIPAGAPAGAHHIVASGIGANGKVKTVSFPITIAAGSGAPGIVLPRTDSGGTATGAGGSGSATGGLPMTGFEVGMASLLGVGLVGAGTISVLAGRRKSVPAA